MHYKGREVEYATKTTFEILGVICLHVCLGEFRVNVWFGVTRGLYTRVLFVTHSIDRFLKGIFTRNAKLSPATPRRSKS